MITAIGSALRANAARVPAVTPEPDDDTPQVEMATDMTLVDIAPISNQAARAEPDAGSRGRGDDRPFSAASISRLNQVSGSLPSFGQPHSASRANASFATMYDPAPAQTPVGRNAPSASTGTSPALARALSEYGAMRGR